MNTAGGAAAISLRELGFTGQINLIGDEPELPYERPTLSKEFLSGADAEPVRLADEARWRELDVQLTLGVSGIAIDRDARIVTLSDGQTISYDRLILATGGRVRRLETPDHPRIHHLRTTADARALAAASKPGARAVIVGGGVIGLETASTLVELGLSVIVLEAGDRLLGRNIPEEAAGWLAAAHARIGVEVRLGASVAAVEERADGTMGGFGLRTTDCRKTYEELTAKGVEFTQPPSERPYGVEAVFRDNSGNWLVLVEPRGYTPDEFR